MLSSRWIFPASDHDRPHLPDLPPEFYARSSDEVARDLVGKVLWRTGVGGGRLTEVEAYLPMGDPASHSYRGRTRRNASMFGPAGHIYLYLNYGVHTLLNVVCDLPDVGAAVLIRSFEPLGDTSLLLSNRLRGSASGNVPSDQRARMRWLACGPGRVGQALDLKLSMDGLSLGSEPGLRIMDDGERPRVGRMGRVGLSKGSDLLLRFVAADSPLVSYRGRGAGGGR